MYQEDKTAVLDLYDELIKRIEEGNETRIHEISWEVSELTEEENQVFFHQCLGDLLQFLTKFDLRQALADQKNCDIEEVKEDDRDIMKYFLRMISRVWSFCEGAHICEDCKEDYYRFKSWADYNL